MSYKSYKDFIEDPGKVYFLKRKASFGNIIDFEKKGNRVVFYLGYKDDEWGWTNKNYKDQTGKTPDWLKPSDDYYGDDWDDAPYEHNAGRVYDEFIQTVRIYYYDTDWKIIEPCDGEINSKYSKEDFKNGKVPCIIVIRDELAQKFDNEYRFSFWWDYINNNEGDYDYQNVECFYFGDILINGITLESKEFGGTF